MLSINNTTSQARLNDITATAAELDTAQTKKNSNFGNILGALRLVTSEVSKKVMDAISQLGNTLSNFFSFSKSFVGATSVGKTEATRIINPLSQNSKKTSETSDSFRQATHRTSKPSTGLNEPIHAMTDPEKREQTTKARFDAQNVRLNALSNRLVDLKQFGSAMLQDIDRMDNFTRNNSEFGDSIEANVEKAKVTRNPSNNSTSKKLTSSKSVSSSVSSSMSQITSKLENRGNALKSSEDQSEKLEAGSSEFANAARQLREKLEEEAQKPWYRALI